MSETVIKQKVSVRAYPGVINDDSMPGETVFDAVMSGFDDTKILDVILSVYEITNDRLFSKRRFMDIPPVMHMYRYLLRSIKGKRKPGNCKPLKYSLNEVGQMTGCDHATVLHSCRTAQDLIQTDKEYRAKYEAVLSKLPRYIFTLEKLY